MAKNISGLGLRVQIISSPIFPQGFTIKEFPSDTDPLVIGNVKITNTEMGINGDLISWNSPAPIPVELSVIPNGEDDQNLKILYNANRPAKNKVSTQDDVTMIVAFPNGKITTLTGGVITDGVASNGITSDGKVKTPTFSFEFENIV